MVFELEILIEYQDLQSYLELWTLSQSLNPKDKHERIPFREKKMNDFLEDF